MILARIYTEISAGEYLRTPLTIARNLRSEHKPQARILSLSDHFQSKAIIIRSPNKPTSWVASPLQGYPSRPDLEPGPLDPESNALNMRVPRLLDKLLYPPLF